jgi:hypothetical protein
MYAFLDEGEKGELMGGGIVGTGEKSVLFNTYVAGCLIFYFLTLTQMSL